MLSLDLESIMDVKRVSKYLAVLFSSWLLLSSLAIAATFDFESNVTGAGTTTVTHTVSGITITLVSNNDTWLNTSGLGAGTNVTAKALYSNNATGMSLVTVSFNSAVDITSLVVSDFSCSFAAGGGAYVQFAVTDGSGNATVQETSLLGGNSVGVVTTLNWTNVTSFNITQVGSSCGAVFTPILDTIIFTASSSPPAVTSATYDQSTGALVVTGTDFEAKAGALNDVDVSKLTLTGEGADTYTLSTSSDVEISSATEFTVTLTGADKTAVDGLLNKNGTSSDGSTTYNLAAADDFIANVTSGDTADATNAVTVSNVSAPTVTSATYDANTGSLVVTGTRLVNKDGATNDVDVSTLTLTGDSGNTYTLTSTDVEITSATAFTVTLNSTDKININGLLNKNGLTSDSGTTYNLAAADNWMTGAAATTDIADTTSNGITVSNVTAPAITSATYDASTGALVVTGTNFVKENGVTNDVDVSTLTLTGDAGATYTLTTTDVEITSATEFTVTLSSTDKTNINGLLNKDGTSSDDSTTYNLAAADNWMPGAAATTDIADATNGITVSNVAAPAITSATYNASTGALVVTGTNFVNENGATNDVDVSTLTLTGEGGATYTLTTSDVEVTSGTEFTVTLNSTDKVVVNGLLNKNGTISDDSTTYNLAAADNWMAGSAATTNIADTTGNGITVSSVSAPTVTSATYDANTGALVVTGTNFVSRSGTTNDVDVSTLTLTGETGGTYTLTTSDVEITSETAFTITLNSTDKLNINGLLNKDGTSSGDSTTYNLAAADNWMAGSAASTNIADTTSNGITVSNVAVPTVTSATYDASTGDLVVTGTNFVSKSGATNDVDVSTLTLTGDAGATYTLTSSDVEITSATAFTVTLSSTDKTNINGLLNKDGLTSDAGTTYNLAAADNWMAGSAAATDIADATSNAITVSNVTAPAITSATYNAGTGALVVTGTNFVNENGSTNDVDISTLTLTGDGGATYTLTTTDVEITSATAFTVTLSSTDLTNINGLLNKNGTSSDDSTTYNLAAADNWMPGAAATTDIADATNAITVSNVTAPAIISATYDVSTGALAVTGTNFVNENGSTNDVDVSTLTVTGEGGGTYTLTTSDVEITSAIAFSITLSSTDALAVNGLLNKNGTSSDDSTTYNLAAADNWMPGAAATTDIADATNAITVSNVAAPTVTSATYDASTGVLAVTGTNFVSKAGATNDVDVSTLTLTGEGSGTYTLTSTTDVEVSSATAFSVTLNSTDKLNVNSLLNKNGTSSGDSTTYNLAAADNWMQGAAATTNIADTSGNGVTVSNVAAPTITSATYDASTGALVVTGTNLVNKAGATNDVDVSTLTITGDGDATYTLTTTDVEISSATAFTVTLNSTDLTNINGLLNKDGTSSDGGTTYNLAAADNWMTGSATATDIADTTGNGITVSNVAAPAITSATYNAGTGALVVTGTRFVNENGATNDVDVSTLTLTGDGGATYALTTTDVEITSATAFTVTLNSTDLTHINGLLNKVGTSSDDGTSYNLAAADNWMAGSAATTDIADTTGNAITVSNVTAPTITSATYNAGTGVFVVTGTNFVNEDGATNDVDVSTLTVTGDASATYTLTTIDVEITSATAFTVTLNSTDLTNVNGLLNKVGTSSDDATTYNLAAADNWMPGAAATTDIADTTGNAITVSNVTAPTITSSTYDATTGVLVITGTNFVNESGATNDVDVSTLTLTGEASGTYTLMTTTDVEITSATSISITLNATDKTGVNNLLNKNGTSANDATTYNLAAADNWMAGSAATTNIADASNSVTVSNVPVAVITSATYDASTGNLVVTGTNFVAKSGAANDVDVSTFTLTGEGNASYTLTSTTDIEITSSTAFTVTLSGSDKTHVDGLLNKNGSSADDSTSYNLAAADDFMANITAGDTSDASNAVTVSNVAAASITSATYDASTGSLVLTGSRFVSQSGSANDLDVSTLTLTGESAATYTLTSTDVDITSASSATITLNSTDLTQINGLLNKNGTSSDGGTAYNLAAADNWMPGVAATTNSADASNAITVSNVAAPAITSATYNANTGALVVTGTGFVNQPGSSNDVDVSKLTLTGEGATTYTLTTTDVDITSATAFTVTLNSTDLTAVNGLLNKNGTSSDGGTAYNLAAADNWMAAAAATSNIADASNTVTVSAVSAPALSSATYDANTGVLTVTATALVNQAGSANDVDVSTLTITGEGAATYTLTSTDVEISSATAFSITLNSTDKNAVNGLLNKNGTSSDGGTTYNLAAADNWMAAAAATTDIADATNAITVSNVAAPTISSASYNAGTGVLTVSGSHFVNKSGATNDVDVSTFTLTGEGGNTYALTSTDVEISSNTAFSITLNATDAINVNGLLNKDGTSSDDGTTYNLAAADNWMTGSAATTDIADSTNAITVSNVTAPTITSASYDASTGLLVVTATGLASQPGATNDIDVSMLTVTGDASASYTLTSPDVEISSATAFTVTLNSTDSLAVNGLLNKNGTSSDDGTTYNLAAADNWMAAAATTTDIADTTSNAITVSNVTAPTVTSATYDASTGALVVTGTHFVNKSGAGNDVDVSLLTLTGEGSAAYTLTSSDVEVTSATAFTVTVNSTDRININGLLNKDGTASDDSTTYNLAAADNWMAGSAATTDSADTTNALTVSNVTAPTVTSATYDTSTAVLVVTGTHFVKKSGATNDVDISQLTLSGEGSATYTLTSTDVEITSATQFSVTLNTTDKLNVNGLLNKNGTSADDATVYNLAAADNWMAAAAASTDIADTSSNAITVSNVVAPSVTSITYDASTGTVVVTGTRFVKKPGSANDVDVSLLSFVGEGGASYTLTDTSDVEITSETSFTLTLSATDKLNVESVLNANGTVSDGNTTYNLVAADNWMAGAAATTDTADTTANAVTVSNIGTPTLTSATYDASTGVLVVTATHLVSKAGASDIDVSQLTLTGQAGDSYTLTSADVEISSATSFSVTLNSSDLTQINGLLNKNGTSADDATSYNLAAADNWLTGAAVSTNIADASNAITVSNVTVPTVTSATYDVSTGILLVTGLNFVNKTGTGNDVDVSMLSVTGEGSDAYTLTSSDVEISSATSFSVTLNSSDLTQVNGLLNKNGTSADDGTTYNLAAADNWMAGSAETTDSADTTANGITVSNVAVPTLTSATYDTSTGVLAITGTNFVNKAGSANDLDVSLLTITGEGGNTYTLTSTDVDISSASSVSVTLNSIDQLNLNGLLNKDGTSADDATTYNLAAADNWMVGSAASTDIADTTANSVTVSNVVSPSISAMTYDASTGTMVVTGSGFVKKPGSANDVDVSLLTVVGEGGDTYTLTDTLDVEVTSNTSFTVQLSANDKLTVDSLLNTNGTASDGSTTYNLQAADNWMTGSAATTDIADTSANTITVSGTSAAVITSATYDATTGVWVVTGSHFVSKVGASDIDVSQFTVTGEGSNDYTLTSADVEISSATSFSITLNSTDKININGLLNKDGTLSDDATTYNLAAADNWLTGSATSSDITDASNAVTVSNVSVPSLSSATFDASTGVLTVTGSGFSHKPGSNNDIDISLVTMTGSGAETYTLTSGDVDISSETQWAVTLSSTDLVHVNGLLNKNGVQADDSTVYNLAAADNWLTSAASSTDIADTSSNAITVSNVTAPTVSSATYNAHTAVLVVTATHLVAKSGTANDIDVSKLTLTGQGGGTYTLTSSDVEVSSATSFSITLNSTDQAQVNALLNHDGSGSNGTQSIDGTIYNIAFADDWLVAAATSTDIADTTNAVTVSQINDAPVNTVPSGQVMLEDGRLVFSTGNSNALTVADEEASTVQLTLNVSHGTLTLASSSGLTFSSGDGSSDASMTFSGSTAAVNTAMNGLSYAPTANSSSAATLTLITSDLGASGAGGTLTDTDTVTITVTAVNDAPIITSTAGTTATEDTLYTYTASVTDVDDANDGVNLTWSLSNAPTGMSVSNTGVVTWTPTEGVSTSGAVTLSVGDGHEDGAVDATELFTIAVTAVNDAPTVTGQNIVTDEDNAVNITLSGHDVDSGDTLTYRVVTAPTQGTLSGTAPDLTYTPNAHYNGSDHFTFVANDGTVDSSAATVAITVTAVNDAPVAVADSASVDEDAAVVIAVLSNDSDVENLINAASVVMTQQPSHGSLSLNTASGAVTYTPDADYHGNDSFIYQVQDTAGLASNTATVSLTVNPVNDAPVGQSDVANTDEDTPVIIDVLSNDTDIDDASLALASLTIHTPPQQGTASIVDGKITYQPALNYSGSDQLLYTVKDASGLSTNPTTVLINIASVNDAPLAVNDEVTTQEDTAVVIALTDNDSDMDGSIDVSTLVLVQPAQQGSVSIDTSTGHATYTPNANVVGVDTFSYVLKDNEDALSNEATVTVTVEAVNDAPRAEDDAVVLLEDVATLINVLENDSDVDSTLVASSVVVTVAPTSGSTSVDSSTGHITYTPGTDFNGNDHFVYQVSDDQGLTDTATVTVGVTAVNDAPIAVNDQLLVDEGAQVSTNVLSNDSDPDNDTLTLVLVDTVAHGDLTINDNGDITYIHDGSETLQDRFTYKANDGQLDSQLATVSLFINASNDRPNAQAQNLTVDEDGRLAITLQGSDAEGGPLSFTITVQPDHGSLLGSLPDLTYIPNLNFNGNDRFSFTVSDGEQTSSEAVVSLTVLPKNDAPLLDNQTLNVIDDGNAIVVDVLASGVSDEDGDTVTLLSARSDFGSVLIVDNQISFTPHEGVTGSVDINYVATDNAGGFTDATLTLVIENQAAPTLTVPASVEVNATGLYTPVDIGVAEAVDAEGKPLPVNLLNGNTLFEPGINVATWEAIDEQGLRSVATQQVSVKPLITFEKDQTVLEGQSVQVQVYLNGVSPEYPLTLAYTVSGTADSSDHDLVDGVIVIDEGVEGTLNVDTFEDRVADSLETIVITLSDTFEDEAINLGSKSVHTITLAEDNIQPEVTVTVEQDAEQRLTVAQDGGNVLLSTAIEDPNPDDSHHYVWSVIKGILSDEDADDTTFTFNPEFVDSGLYVIRVEVSDDGDPVLSDRVDVYIEVIETLTPLSEALDSDNDQIPDALEGHGDSDKDGIPDYLDARSECNVLPEQVIDQDTFQIEGEPGVCLRKGAFTVNNQTQGVQITEEDIEVLEGITLDEEYTNVGGIFDYIAIGLPDEGQTYEIVMPQRRVIPVNGVYRKFIEGIGWMDFVEDEKNSVSSAPGVEGFCPPPGGDVWELGLIAGYWCVQLSIEDGGPNDSDGVANGTIVDPGGVSAREVINMPVAVDDVVEVAMGVAVLIDVLANDTDADQDVLSVQSASALFGMVTIESDGRLNYVSSQGFIGTDTISYTVIDGQGGSDTGEVSVTVTAEQEVVVDIDGGGSISLFGLLLLCVACVLRHGINVWNVWGRSVLGVLVVVLAVGSAVTRADEQGWVSEVVLDQDLEEALEGEAYDALVGEQALVPVERRSRGHGRGGLLLDGYVGTRFGFSYGEGSAGDINQDLMDAGLTAVVSDFDDSDVAFSFFVGMQVTKYWSMELGYLDLGEYSLRVEGQAQDVDAFVDAVEEVHPESGRGLFMAGNYVRYVGKKTSLQGRLGLFNWRGRYDGKVLDDEREGRDRDSGIDVTFGLGVNYDLDESVRVGLLWERFGFDEYDVDFVGVGIVYGFGGIFGR